MKITIDRSFGDLLSVFENDILWFTIIRLTKVRVCLLLPNTILIGQEINENSIHYVGPMPVSLRKQIRRFIFFADDFRQTTR